MAAYSDRVKSASFVASTDLRTAQFHIVDLTAAHKVSAAAANLGIGVLQNKPNAGEHATVAMDGATKCVAGGAVSVGDYIASANSGFASVVTSGALTRTVIGRALTAALSGSMFTLEIGKFFSVQTGGLPE